jgi:glucosamine-6-phosphate deaminase
MRTFSKFKKISEVPQYGLTVGLSTISKLSKSAILVLTGKEKSYALQKIIEASKFDKSWPSTIIFDCEKYKIYVDQKALQNK